MSIYKDVMEFFKKKNSVEAPKTIRDRKYVDLYGEREVGKDMERRIDKEAFFFFLNPLYPPTR